ncbi:LysR substrate-binding domain-containing protein [Pseudomonas nitroreducens]|uniref:LysR substrate-binding domain-containing protein n=1 Tax=Pseudomonas nitroreducens TaxID=46680 RepID=UPI002F355BC9
MGTSRTGFPRRKTEEERCIPAQGPNLPFTSDRPAPRLTSRLGFDDVETLALAAMRGAGLIHVPRWLVRESLRTGALVQVLETASVVNTPLHVLWPHTRFLPCKLRVTIDALLEAIPPLLAPD